MLAYSGLFPGHIVSQFVTDLAEHGFGHAAMAGCHDEGEANPQPANGAKKRCPFCAGYASFQLAALGSPTILPPPIAVGGDLLAITDDVGLRKSVITPQSRGPPLLSA
jgi:hypothetical protein